ncbi:hypothetical protein CJJ09_001937 [Candidozyma auris]|nr:hypothetical protein CJJ09_001937 [[Candida] auris]
MKLSVVAVAGLAAVAAAADTSLTVTKVVTANGATYTKTRTEKYTGQATTTPTSGTYTTTIVIEGEDATYTKTATETFGLESVSTTLDCQAGFCHLYQDSLPSCLTASPSRVLSSSP